MYLRGTETAHWRINITAPRGSSVSTGCTVEITFSLRVASTPVLGPTPPTPQLMPAIKAARA